MSSGNGDSAPYSGNRAQMIAKAAWTAGERGQPVTDNPFDAETHQWFMWRRWWKAGRDTYDRNQQGSTDDKAKAGAETPVATPSRRRAKKPNL